MAKFALVTDEWMNDLGLQATAIQCWSSMQKNSTSTICTHYEMMSEQTACSRRLRSGHCWSLRHVCPERREWKPSALVDWNNNYGSDENKMCLLPLRQLGEGLFCPDIRIAPTPILDTWCLGEA